MEFSVTLPYIHIDKPTKPHALLGPTTHDAHDYDYEKKTTAHHECRSQYPRVSRGSGADECLQFVPINPRPMLQSLFVLPTCPSSWSILLTREAYEIQCQSAHSSASKVGKYRVQGKPCQCRFLHEHSALRNRGICRWKEHRKLRTGLNQVFPPLHSNLLKYLLLGLFC